MPLWVAILLGVVEGLTEYLPVSSTGHLVLVSALVGESGESSAAFNIVIQFGAILAVVVQYRDLLRARLRDAVRGDGEGRRFFAALLAAFLPTMVVGLALRKSIKTHLFGPAPVALALVAGGVLMIAVERYRKATKATGDLGLEHVTLKRALIMGVGQCFSLWPGASRSMCTIVAGQLAGLSTVTAAEFSFLLGLPTLGAATLYEAYKSRALLLHGVGALSLACGLLVSFLVAWAAIAAFIRYLGRRGLEPFGAYRIVLGALVAWMVFRS